MPGEVKQKGFLLGYSLQMPAKGGKRCLKRFFKKHSTLAISIPIHLPMSIVLEMYWPPFAQNMFFSTRKFIKDQAVIIQQAAPRTARCINFKKHPSSFIPHPSSLILHPSSFSRRSPPPSLVPPTPLPTAPAPR